METATAAPRKVIGVCLEAEQIAALERLSEQQERSKSFFVRKAVDAFLAQEKKQSSAAVVGS